MSFSKKERTNVRLIPLTQNGGCKTCGKAPTDQATNGTRIMHEQYLVTLAWTGQNDCFWSILKWHNLEIAAWNPLKPWKTMGHWGTEGPNALRFCPPKKVHICEQNAGPIPRQRTEASQSFQEGMDTKTWLIPPNNHWNRIITDRLLTRSSAELKVRRRTKYLAYIAYIC